MTQTASMTTYYCEYIVDLTAQLSIEAPEGLDHNELKELFTKKLLKLTIGASQDIDIIASRHFDVDGDEL
jgi:hypothetical protein